MNSDSQIRIVLIDDHKIFREGVKKVVEMEPHFIVVGKPMMGKKGSVSSRNAT